MSASPLTESALAADLVHRIRQGDRHAETQLVEHFSRGVSFFLRRHAWSREVADDLHQETFRIALERLRAQPLDDPEGLGGFLIGVARNLLRNEVRRRSRAAVDGQETLLELARDPSVDPLRSLIDDEDARQVRRLVGELPNLRDRQILYRFYIAEEAKERICADLGMKESHLRRVLFRARQRLKTLLTPTAYEAAPARTGPGDRMEDSRHGP